MMDAANDIKRAASDIIRRGWAPVVVRYGDRRPIGGGWQNRRITAEEVESAFRNRSNIGILLGEPSGGVVDVDIDDPLVHRFKHMLPPTDMIHGRPANPASHYWYQVRGDIPPTKQFKHPLNGNSMLVEIRSTGGQTVVPPSYYSKEDEHLAWVRSGEPGQVDATVLHSAVAKMAAMAILVENWHEGSRHVKALALSGMLLRGGMSVGDAEAIMRGICLAAGDDELEDRLATVATTAEKLAAGENVTGATRLSEIMDPAIVGRVQDWLELKNDLSALQGAGSVLEGWDIPMRFDHAAVPDIPAALLPGVYGDFARALAEAAEVPEGLPVMTVLGVLSAACAKRFVVSPLPGWREPVNLYAMVALPPANNKSLILRSCLEPVESWEFDKRLDMDTRRKSALSTRRNQESQIQSMRARAARERDPDRQCEMFADVSRLESELVDIPVLPQVYLNDVTPETLARAVCEQGGRIAILSDEGGIVETMGGLYSNGHANYDILLKGIDGGRLRLKRKEQDFDINPYLTILLVVQPQIISNLGRGRAYQGRGLQERFLYVLPKSKLGHRSLNAPAVPEELRKRYIKSVKSLLDIQPIIEHRLEMPRVLTLSDGAHEVWQPFRHRVEERLGPNGRLSSCLGWGGKIVGFCLRIAGLMHVAEHGLARNDIQADCMTQSVALCELLIEHAMVAYGWMVTDQAHEDAFAIYEWIVTQELRSFRRTDCQRKFHGRFTRVQRFDAALAVLHARNLIGVRRFETTTRGKRATAFYDVNPLLYDKDTE